MYLVLFEVLMGKLESLSGFLKGSKHRVPFGRLKFGIRSKILFLFLSIKSNKCENELELQEFISHSFLGLLINLFHTFPRLLTSLMGQIIWSCPKMIVGIRKKADAVEG